MEPSEWGNAFIQIQAQEILKSDVYVLHTGTAMAIGLHLIRDNFADHVQEKKSFRKKLNFI